MKLTYLRALKCFPRKLWVTGYKLLGILEPGGAVTRAAFQPLWLMMELHPQHQSVCRNRKYRHTDEL